jgi:hypothetical protein
MKATNLNADHSCDITEQNDIGAKPDQGITTLAPDLLGAVGGGDSIVCFP